MEIELTEALKGTILVVDDQPANLRLLSGVLGAQGYTVRAVTRGTLALNSVHIDAPDLILLDVALPDMDGYEVCRQLKRGTDAQHIPIIFLSALDDVSNKLGAFQAGGVDYITKPFQVEEVLARVETHLKVRRMYQQLEAQNARLQQEIAERKQVEEELSKFKRAVEQSSSSVVITDQKGDIEYVNPKFTEVTGYPFEEVYRQNPRLLKSGVFPTDIYQQMWQTISSGQSWHSEFHNRKKNGELFWELASISPVFNHEGVITHYVAVKEDITERKRMEEALQQAHDDLEQRVQERTADLLRLNETLQDQIKERARQERQREAILTVAMALRTAPSRSEMVTILLEQVGELLQADGAILLTRDAQHGEVVVEQAYGIWEHLNGARVVEDDGSTQHAQDPTNIDQHKVARRDAAVAQSYLFGTVKSLACIPLIAHDWSIGTLGVGCQHVITRENMRLLSAIGDMIANALRRTTLHEQTERRLRHLQALHAIDEAITTSLDLNYTLDVVLEQVMTQLHIDAVAVLLVAEAQGQFVYTAGRGFRTEEIQQRALPLNEGYIGHAAREGRIVCLEDSAQTEKVCLRESMFQAEGFVSYYGVPLIARGQVKGVLELFHRSRVLRDDEWHDFMKTLAGQASIAIDNADVVAQLQQRTSELARLNEAYECFVPREFLGQLNKGNIVEVQLGDQVQRSMTVMFADIRAFTALSEQMTPEENFAFINTYLSRVSPVIRQYHGFIDKYIGDAIMALFPHQAEDALEAAIVMLREIARYNVRRQQHSNEPITVGIGLHTGSLMLGIIGEEQRKQGTVIADAVNLTSRLEGLTKVYGASIIISEQTLFSLNRPGKYTFRFLGKVRVHGKQDAVAVFDILDGLPDKEQEMRRKTLSDFEKGLLFYYNQEFAEALIAFQRVLEVDPEDKAALLYKQRSTHYSIYGVPSDWVGIEILAEK